jgi:hypothetical protein
VRTGIEKRNVGLFGSSPSLTGAQSHSWIRGVP